MIRVIRGLVLPYLALLAVAFQHREPALLQLAGKHGQGWFWYDCPSCTRSGGSLTRGYLNPDA